MKGGNNVFLMEFGGMTLVNQGDQLVAIEIEGILKEFKEICEAKKNYPNKIQRPCFPE